MRDPNVIPTFCEDCGGRLTWSPKEPIGYDPDSGARRFYQSLICPKKRWWRMGHADPLKRRGYHVRVRYSKVTKENSI